ncbi:MAG: TetR/AcrR family transcriptional regulator [Archangiaceae bacterium]|nr:TetR/AcrR family transcriptional regulator [Archangiaceae bacterium]
MTYHHGALFDSLVEAAGELLEADGLEALSLREVARRAGVSTAAPYHHFTDKQALLVALATDGFDDLEAALTRATAKVKNPRARLQAMADGYLRFAKQRPALYQLMFSPLLAGARGAGPLFEASQRALAVLRGAVLTGKPGADGVDVLLAWALGHGVASLVELGLFDGPSLGAPENVDALVMARLVGLLSARGGRKPPLK